MIVSSGTRTALNGQASGAAWWVVFAPQSYEAATSLRQGISDQFVADRRCHGVVAAQAPALMQCTIAEVSYSPKKLGFFCASRSSGRPQDRAPPASLAQTVAA